MNLNKIARQIINQNIYLSLATSFKNRNWIAPLFYVTDKKYLFYFISEHKSLHAQHIRKNPNSAVTIFNSQEKPEQVNGIQMSCRATELNSKIKPVIKLIYQKTEAELLKLRFPDHLNPESYLGKSPFRIYQITPKDVYILDPKITHTDKRIKVDI